MYIQPSRIAGAIGLVLVASQLVACGGGGGGNLVASDPPPPVAPPPAGAPVGPCPAPISGDCNVTASGRMFGGRDSAGRLIVHGPAQLVLGSDDPSFDPQLARATYAFAAGVDIDNGMLDVERYNTLKADVRVRAGTTSGLRVAGTVIGRVDNAGTLQLYPSGVVSGPVENHGTVDSVGGRIDGDLRNAGTVRVSGAIFDGDADLHVGGDFTQTAGARLLMALPPAGQEAYFSGRLRVDGRADLAGVLELFAYTDAWGPYPAPGLQTFHLLHAGGGITGTFDPQGSPGPFFSGTIRYDANDVWFDLTRVTAGAAMASGAQATAVTRASAANVDRALAIADGFARAPTPEQQRFLASAGRLLRLPDMAQATRALDSVSGVAQSQLADAAFDAATPLLLAQQRDEHRPDGSTGFWMRHDAGGSAAGNDAWLSPRLLAGVYAVSGGGADALSMDGVGVRRDSVVGLSLRRVDDRGGYAGVDLGYAQRHAVLQRPIDLGTARSNARSQRRFDVATLAGEIGRTWRGGDGRVTPFLRVDASTMQAARSIEQGGTGFELALAPAFRRRVQAGGGVRTARDWRFGSQSVHLDAAAGVSHLLMQSGDPLRGAFTGVSGVWFDLPTSERDTRGWLQWGLSGSAGVRWSWSLSGERRSDAYRAWRLQLTRDL